MAEALRWAGRILLWLVILTCCAILVVAVLVPRVAGAVPYAVMTGSMKPALPPGTLVVVKPVDPAKISIGDVITYQLESGRPTVVTHRVIGTGIGGTNETRFRTKGDASGAPDQQWVRPVQVRGKVWYAVPYLGYPTQVITGRQHQLLVYVVAAGLIGYAAFMFGSAIKDRTRRSSEAPERDQQERVTA